MLAAQAKSVRELCDRFVDDYLALDPILATAAGIRVHDEQLTDFSPDGHQARARLSAATLAAVRDAAAPDHPTRTAKAVFVERTGIALDVHLAGLDCAGLNVIDSPVQAIRQVFDIMPNRTERDWEVIAARLRAVPEAMAGVRASVLHSAARGIVSARRQVLRVAEMCDAWAGVDGGSGFFTAMVGGARGVVPESLGSDLARAARSACAAFAGFAAFLRGELASRALEKDAVGEEVYRLWSRHFTGARLDLAEAYEWGWHEFSRLEREMADVAHRIEPGATPAGAAALLDGDPRYLVHGRQAYRDWMQELVDRALDDLRDDHFEIPEPLMTLECRIAPAGGGVGAYYTRPSSDFSRPGRMWCSLPAGKDVFARWRTVAMAYHEGVPGHHLQAGTAVHQAGTLNRFQRLMCWVAGYSEGWALYAERLMRELGYLDDDGNLLGMLDANLFRAARVVVDIGMHLELRIPRGFGFHEGERWTPELGLEFLRTRTITDPLLLRDEIDRYLGWPGQAPAYKLGERLWLAAREDAKARSGPDFDLGRFHTQALRLGPMGLDTLRDTLADRSER